MPRSQADGGSTGQRLGYGEEARVRGVSGRPKETSFVCALPRAPVIALYLARTVASFFVAKSAHSPWWQ